jgi:hypothetical protein
MNIDQPCSVEPNLPLVDAAWSVLDAANDLCDTPALDACRRVIDASLRGTIPARADMDVVFNFFS